MIFGKDKDGVLSTHFKKQLHSLSGDVPNIPQIEFILSLPGNSRFPYINKNYLNSELFDAFNTVCHANVKLVSVKAFPDDDHFICALISIEK